jgi:leukotriene A-4 hydrolase/aminopeptidase
VKVTTGSYTCRSTHIKKEKDLAMRSLNPFLRLALVATFFAVWTACEQPADSAQKQPETPMEEETFFWVEDPHTFALPAKALMTHLDLDISVDFKKKEIAGIAKIRFENRRADRLMLDTKGLVIEKVLIGDRETEYTLHEEIPHLGSALEITVDTFTTVVSVHYRTTPGAEALQWLQPVQTAGKQKPFLFTQSQAILCRTWVPCQDSPGIRFTYQATVRTDPGLMALMSAENPRQKAEDGAYQFNMEQPIPAYLLALTVGDFQFKPIGARTGVYAEQVTLEKAAYELADMEKMLVAAEKLYGPYQWGRYDVIVLPPSFPFGGMENPRLTFATPTILAGDRSLTSLIAHELAHSWSGNLVTNATWNDFWLNEGFTVYFEYRIMEAIYGKDFADMLALISYQDLLKEMESLNYGEDTRLKLNLEGRNPDDGVTAIAYDKGYYFLKLIEQTVGLEAWDQFLKQYFQDFAFRSVSTEQFLPYLHENLLKHTPGAAEKIQPDQWVYGTGLPENCPIIPSKKFDQATEEAARFMKGATAASLQTKGWAFQQWVHFLRQLPVEALNTRQMAELDAAFGLTNHGNNEILFEWLLLSIRKDYQQAYPSLQRFLTNVGRRKFIAPLYAAMAEKKATKEMALRVYKQARPNYHFVATSTIDKILE